MLSNLHIKQWQAIAIAYGILLAMSETQLGGIAEIMAWGIAITYVIDVNITKGNLLNNLFGST